jgi:hypothetical protein
MTCRNIIGVARSVALFFATSHCIAMPEPLVPAVPELLDFTVVGV